MKSKTKFWLGASVISFLVILSVVLLTSPINKIGFAIIFFVALLGFLISFGHFALYLRRGSVSSKARRRLLIISIFLVLLVMFKSVQSLSWIDALILLLVLGGLLFYSSRRSA